jgi:hypothetical protein
MDCSAARQHLSAFHDGELAPELRASVAEHLATCDACAQRLLEVRRLSDAAAKLPGPEVPAELWANIEKRLAAQAAGSRSPIARKIHRRRWAALAAALLVLAAGASILWLWPWENEHTHVAVNFGQYLDQFDRDPAAAQQVLLTQYQGRAVSYDEAATEVRYRPATPEQLPGGLAREKMYLLRMPCCTCVQAVYRRDGQRLAIFEHVDDQPIWFGERPTIQTRCNGMATSLVQCDECLAASWKRNDRFLTVVGARDLEQIAALMAYLGSPEAAGVPQ